MLGAMASAGVVKALFPGPLSVTTSLGGGTNLAQGLFIEMVGQNLKSIVVTHLLTQGLVFDCSIGFHHHHVGCKF